MERPPTYAELIKQGVSPDEARKFLMEQRPQSPIVRTPSLEAFTREPTVEEPPLKEEPIAILPAPELAKVINNLRSDTDRMTQIRIDFDGQKAWVVPVPRFTIMFEIPHWVKLGEYPIADPGKVSEYHESLKYGHEDWVIERKVERGYSKLGEQLPSVNVFYGHPPERRHIRRSDPYLLALEVLKLNPKRLSLQTIPRMIRPPKAIPVRELLFGLKKLPSPEAVWRREVPGVRPLTPKEREELRRAGYGIK